MDKTVCVWDVETGKTRRKYRNHAGAFLMICLFFDKQAFSGAVNAVAYNEESTVVFSACLDGCIRAWDTKAFKSDTPIQKMDEASDSASSFRCSCEFLFHFRF